VAGGEIAVRKYVVRLSSEEREQLASLIRSGRRPAQLLTKARILLKAARFRPPGEVPSRTLNGEPRVAFDKGPISSRRHGCATTR
jgi:hypothetical protein